MPTDPMHDTYENPLITRYASREMATLWGDQRKFSTWRRLWVALAEAEAELGLPVTPQQIAELRAHTDDINFDAAQQYERKLRHDVMAHVHAYGDQCPAARPIIHLGATSCYVTDNTDLILIRESLKMVATRLAAVIGALADFAKQYRDLPTLSFTHLQPAQPTTVGRRACLWAYDLVLDLSEVEHRIESLKARSVKGTTGTQASFLELFDGDHAKVRKLEQLVAQKMGFNATYAITGQTYSRKIDAQVLDTLSGIAASSHKVATDLRLLANRKEIEEPFEKDQIGSSAMAYKRNPMRSERICALARFAMNLASNADDTHATQWFERTLDDSANRRLVIPQAFLAIDAILILYQNVATGLVVYPQVIAKHLREELPFMATENILMAAVAAGGDRQTLHELIRQHSQAAAAVVKEQGGPNDLIARLKGESAFADVDIEAVIDPATLTGRSPQQVDKFLAEIVAPIRGRYSELTADAKVRV
ncbi:MAG TPA: adenylosuccinate lyase [Lacipirellulaceae bacterium]|jgi:adenylosuccinate lyase|nr:adenylosuccinate lyase [Lacipirellulaceae bacterium]